jgi:hypothetical protein
MKVTKSTTAMPSPQPACEDRLQLNWRGLTGEPVMCTGKRASMVMMRMRIRRKKDRKPMMDYSKLWTTEGTVLESVMIGQYISDQ